MAVKEGDFIKLQYTGKVQETDEIFDTTDEKVAEEAGLHVENKLYGPIPIIVGGGHVLKAMDDAIVGMEEGEEKNLDITPEEGFGVRDPNLMQLIPMSEFRKQNIKPQIGMNITLEGNTGKIRSVSGGRVRVDFNHELAGKNLNYQIKVGEIITDDEDKVKSLIQLHYPHPNLDTEKHQIQFEAGKVVIIMDEMAKFDQRPYMEVTMARFRIARDIQENMDVDTVEFVDVFEKKEKEEEMKESTEENKDVVAEVAEEVLKEE
jgi:FKBP-type peptidyl-prolyl cis-trans isomerase SlyD